MQIKGVSRMSILRAAFPLGVRAAEMKILVSIITFIQLLPPGGKSSAVRSRPVCMQNATAGWSWHLHIIYKIPVPDFAVFRPPSLAPEGSL